MQRNIVEIGKFQYKKLAGAYGKGLCRTDGVPVETRAAFENRSVSSQEQERLRPFSVRSMPYSNAFERCYRSTVPLEAIGKEP